jgi:hypothetical protein
MDEWKPERSVSGRRHAFHTPVHHHRLFKVDAALKCSHLIDQKGVFDIHTCTRVTDMHK